MLRYFLFPVFIFIAAACNQSSNKHAEAGAAQKPNTIRLYSKAVSDSFSVFVNLPNDYNENKNAAYPVVYLLDANLYFDIVATILNKYSDVGLAPPVVLVGIGYKDFAAMDSLRNRDDTYPAAIPEYEMGVSGGAGKFLSFINTELVPYIDKKYRTDTLKRVLMGHSLGGYFTTYAFLQQLTGNSNIFSSYIAASPSIHYNKYWLLNQLKAVSVRTNKAAKVKMYITYGSEEDAESQTDSSIIKLGNLQHQLADIISVKQAGYTDYKMDIFSNLSHMDTQLPTFIKGLQWSLNEENK